MFLFEMESESVRNERLNDLAQRTLHRLGDSAEAIWSRDEVESYIRLGARELTDRCRIVWDQVYLENLPAGFSYTARFESRYVDFDYNQGGYTFEDEEDEVEEVEEFRLAYHSNPSELSLLSEVRSSLPIPAVASLPPTLTDIERATQDTEKVEATNHRRVSRHDSRYQITEGEVFAYLWQKEGPATLRKVRVPNESAEIYEVEGSWGAVRDVGDVTDEDVTGSWGIPRRIPSWHPMGWSKGWGTPRRFYKEESNFKLEGWRHPHLESMRDSELPSQYFRYLVDYAQWRALTRNGPGQDYKLAQLFDNKWKRNIDRILKRIERKRTERQFRMGGAGDTGFSAPPRPRLPWQYGQRVR